MDAPAPSGSPLRSGSTLGPYTIVARIGSGGMGEVYRAHDDRLKRDVAVKVLLPEVAGSPARLARFQREARLLAALNHPRIAAIYGLEEASGTPALVIELVEGATLADRLRAGPLPIDEAIDIARQIADGLEYAHEKGILHRDLKPANINIAPDDAVKILDFGLAKALEGDAAADSPLNSPTLTWMATQAGVILGTAGYMAPEQAKGKPVDRRADIWAFGCVLYEMLAGAPPFRGDTVADILAAVVREEPDWTRLPPGTPPRLRDLVRRCLRKDIRQRLQAIGDARILLEDVQAGQGEEPSAAALSGPSSRARWLVPGLIGAAITAAAAVLVLATRPAPPAAPRPVVRFTLTLPTGQQLSGLGGRALGLSRDGRQLTYVAAAESPPQIYVRALDALETHPIPGTEGANQPTFSPDGRWLAFLAGGKLKKVPLAGGTPQILADATNVQGIAWTDDHTIVFAPYASPLQEVSDSGGTPRPLTQFRPGETLHLWPGVLPGDRVLFAAFSAGTMVFGAQPLAGGARHDLIRAPGGLMPAYVPPDHLVYGQNGALMAVPLETSSLTARDDTPATPVVRGVLSSGIFAQYAVSASGTLAYVPGPVVRRPMRLALVSRDGSARPLGSASDYLNQPRISPDGRRVAVDTVDASGNMQVSMYEFDHDAMRPFTFGGNNRHPVWTPDSRRVIFMIVGDDGSRIAWQAADRSGGPETLVSTPESEIAGVLAIPSSYANGVLILAKLFSAKATEFWAVPIGGAASEPVRGERFLESRTADGGPQLSPDGHWLAYADEAGAGREIFVRAYPGPGGPWQISSGGGNEPQWNPQGGELFYRIGDRMMSVRIDTRSGFNAGEPTELFRGNFVTTGGGYVRANYDVTHDGQHFVMLQSLDQAPAPVTGVNIVVNWSDELQRLVPTAR